MGGLSPYLPGHRATRPTRGGPTRARREGKREPSARRPEDPPTPELEDKGSGGANRPHPRVHCNLRARVIYFKLQFINITLYNTNSVYEHIHDDLLNKTSMPCFLCKFDFIQSGPFWVR